MLSSVCGQLDQLFGRVRDHLILELAQQRLAADRVADDLPVLRSRDRGRSRGGWSALCPRGRFAAQHLPPSATTRAAATASTEARGHRAKSLPEKGGVSLESLVGGLVRLLDPPGEERVIAVVKAEPAAQAYSAGSPPSPAPGWRPFSSRLSFAARLAF